MGIFGKIKQFFGVGTVKVTLSCPPSFSTNDATIDGNIELMAKSDQVVEHVEVELEEIWTTGRGEDKTEKKFELGKVKFPGFTMKAGETKTIQYSLPFSYAKSKNEEMAEKGGITGGLGKMAKFANAEKSTFRMTATCDVKGATFDPNDVKEIKKSN